MVEEDIGELPVQAVIDGIGPAARPPLFPNNADEEVEGVRGEEAAWLCNPFDAPRLLNKVKIDSEHLSANVFGFLFEVGLICQVAAANIDDVGAIDGLEVNICGTNSSGIGSARKAAAANMETDSVNGEVVPLGGGCNMRNAVTACAKLGREGHGTVRIVNGNTNEGAPGIAGELLHFLYRIYNSEGGTYLFCVADCLL